TDRPPVIAHVEVQVGVERDPLEDVIIVLGLMWDAEAGMCIVLVALADLATEAEVAGGIVCVERDVLQGVKEVSTVPRLGEVTVICVEAEQCVGWRFLVWRRLRRVLRQDRLAWINRWWL